MSVEHEDPGDAFDLERDLGRLVRRLRGMSPVAWRSRRAAVEDLLTALEKVAAELEGRPPRPVPALPDHARADAVAVLGGDAVAAARETLESANLATLKTEIDAALERTL